MELYIDMFLACFKLNNQVLRGKLFVLSQYATGQEVINHSIN